MKKVAAIILVLCVVVLSGCGKSDNAKAADQMILSIGTIAEDSGERIRSAEAAVEALSEKELATLDNLDLLKQARAEYDQLLEEKQRQEDMEAAQVAIDAIEEIGELAYDSGEKIAAARNAYDSLEEQQQAYVSNYDALLYDEEHLSDVKVATAIALIDKLGEVAYPDLEPLKPIQEVYKLMSAEEKARVTNFDKYQAQIDNYNRGYVKTLVSGCKLRCTKFGDRYIEVYFDFTNENEKTIKYVRMNVRFKNAVGDVLKYKSKYDYVSLEDVGPYAKGQGSKGNSECWTFYSSQLDVYNISSYELIYLEFEYTDGTKSWIGEDAIRFLYE